MARSTKTQQARSRLVRRIVLGTAVLGVTMLAVLAWRWQATLPVEGVAVEGMVWADSSEVVRMAAVDADSTMLLFDLDPALIADRVRRAPWVREARVRRLPTGTLSIRVEEREPAVLVLAPDGRPSHFLDAEGFSLPLRPGAVYDVPLLRGSVPAYHPTQPVESASLRDLLAALAEADAETDALVSDLTLAPDGSATLYTTPGGTHAAIPVRLGLGGYAEKLRRLDAFWTQAILSRPATTFRTVDLRFDGQVVTDETTPEPDPVPDGIPAEPSDS